MRKKKDLLTVCNIYDSITIDNNRFTNNIDSITINNAQSTIDLLGL